MKMLFSLIAILMFAFCACVQSVNAQKIILPRCPVGADPVDKNRQPTADEEVIVNPADQRIKYESGNGTVVECNFQAGSPVVVDKVTGIAKWAYGCGNGIITLWIPKRPPVAKQEPLYVAPTSIDLSGDVNVHHDGDINVHHDGRVDVYNHNEDILQRPVPPREPSWWCHKACKITLVTVAAIGGGFGIYEATHHSSKGGTPPSGVTTLPFTKVVKGVANIFRKKY